MGDKSIILEDVTKKWYSQDFVMSTHKLGLAGTTAV